MSETQHYENSSLDNTQVQKIQSAIKHFWSRWTKEYLSELRERQKIVGGHKKRIIAVGNIVIVHEDHTPRQLWRLA